MAVMIRKLILSINSSVIICCFCFTHIEGNHQMERERAYGLAHANLRMLFCYIQTYCYFKVYEQNTK